jgi:hypothetical protein
VLRLIGSQFIECSDKRLLEQIECSEEDVEGHLRKFDNVVLFIDELNALSEGLTVDRDCGDLLRKMFLDVEGRYLVFTTHWLMTMETITKVDNPLQTYMASSYGTSRGVIIGTMPESTDITDLKKMAVSCHWLTRAEVAIYGGIPSLIYCVKENQTPSPIERVIGCKFDEAQMNLVLPQLALEVIDGYRLIKHMALRQFDSFSTVTEDGKAKWPLCYISSILKFQSIETDASKFIVSLCSDLLTYAGEIGSGKDWETIVHIAVTFRCICQQHFGKYAPFNIITSGVRPNVKCAKLTSSSLEDARSEIKNICGENSEPTLWVFVPSCSSFPLFDGFIVYHTSQGFYTIGYQIKLNRDYPNHKIVFPSWVNKGILIRGNATETVAESKETRWQYFSKKDVKTFLGHSLESLIPDQW